MTTEDALFTLPASPPPALARLRAEYAEALADVSDVAGRRRDRAELALRAEEARLAAMADTAHSTRAPMTATPRILRLTLKRKWILRLTLKRKWFDMIASGEKREEYRVPGPWILSRLEGKEYDRIEFKNGYGPNVPTMEVEYLGWEFSFGRREWGGGSNGDPFATIMLGRVLSLKNHP